MSKAKTLWTTEIEAEHSLHASRILTTVSVAKAFPALFPTEPYKGLVTHKLFRIHLRGRTVFGSKSSPHVYLSVH